MERGQRAYQRFFAELKRRRVFNTAAIYGGVAFIVFQAADFVVPALRLPDSVATAIVFMAVVVFPFVLVLSWFFNLTPDGLESIPPPERGELDTIVAQPRWRRWPVGVAAAAGVFLFLGGIGWHFWPEDGAAPLEAQGSSPSDVTLAVLPFLNLTTEQDGMYLSWGIAMELSDGLRRLRGLRVTGRTSASSFDDTGVDLVRVAEELKVQKVLEGSVGEEGEYIEVRLSLGRPDNSPADWTRQYRLPKDDLLVALDGVARDVAVQLGVDLPADMSQPLVVQSTPHYPAYCDYVRGRYLASRLTSESLELAIKAFQRALLLDPQFSLAWSGLARAYVLLPDYGGPPAPEVLPYAQAALNRAFDTGVDMAEAYATSGFLKWLYLWDTEGAESDLARSLRLDPLNPTARYWLARVFTTMRRWEEARQEIEVALTIDPLSPAAHLTLGLLLFCEGRAGAADAFRRGLELAPELHSAAFLLGTLLALEGDLDGAAVEFQRFSDLTGGDRKPLDAYLSALVDPGLRSAAVLALQAPTFFGPTQGGALLAHLGESDASLDLLGKAAQDRSPYLIWANALPHFDGMRDLQRFQSVMSWVGF